MSKKLYRILPTDLPAKNQMIEGKEIHVVLKNGSTLFGTLEGMAEEKISLINHRFHKQIINLSDIEEILLDELS